MPAQSTMRAAPDYATEDVRAVQAARASWREFLALLRLPNVTADAADVCKTADWLSQAFARRGFAVTSLPNGERPMLLAGRRCPDPAAPTILCYMHMDAQPVANQPWSQPSPWQPTLRPSWSMPDVAYIDPSDALAGDAIDRDARLVARAVADDKGPIMMLLAALDSLAEEARGTSVHLKVLLDSEEEIGAPNLGTVVSANREALKADAMLVLDGSMHASNRPTMILGNRGAFMTTLTVFGPRRDLHSGQFGNYAANPVFRLAMLLASMKDDDGRVRVDGFYDGIALTDADRRQLESVPDDDGVLRARAGIAQPERVGGTYQEALQYPTLNVMGIAAAQVGAAARTIIPAQATASFDVRTVPETDPERLFGLLRAHVLAQGFHLIEGEPTEDDRRRYPKLARLVQPRFNGMAHAVRTPADEPVCRWVEGALVAAHGEAPVCIRMMGGSVPTGIAVRELGVPCVLLPLVNADNNQHSHDENLRLGNYIDGIRTLRRLLTHPF
ncbi:M20/M25/M40 family metallo-hydrolase [Cupriavidus necator]|uniref:M20/M25/M40 family metallo-hydrolase n=1 Tax=Cupriavidus necator TaxID=106590 RepID=UPI003ECFB1BD